MGLLSVRGSSDIGTIGESADSSYSPTQMQRVLDKLDELINALPR